MNSSSRSFALIATFLQITIALWPIVAVHAQGKPEVDDTVYVPGYSAEDRLKRAEKMRAAPRYDAISTLTPPTNDNFANASGFIGAGGSGFTLATNIDATGETGEPIHGAGFGGTGSAKNSIWYSFTASQTRVITISTSAGGNSPISDTVISLYQGASVATLTALAENDDYPGLGFFSKITLGVVAGETYRLAVDGFGAATGDFYVNYAYSTAAPNDNFSEAELFTGANSPFIGITGSNVNATGESGEPNHANNSGTLNSIWYSWMAPDNASVTFTTAGSTFDTTLAVYIGSSLGSLSLVASDDNDGPGSRSRVTFNAVTGLTYRIAIDGVGAERGNTLLNWGINRAESSKQFDFDGDLKTDYSVYRPGNNVWYTLRSSDAGFQAMQWGLAGDVLVPGVDYEGDDKADFCVWRPSTGVFYAIRSSSNTMMALQWGTNGDVPVQGDFEGDDRSDFAVWRPSSGVFYVYQSEFQTMLAYQWGTLGDKPAPGDYDGDGKTDFAIWRPSEGRFYLVESRSSRVDILQWGLSGDLVVPGDYDRDGKNDLAVYRPGTNNFYARRSSDAGLYSEHWGIAGDLPAPGDYDGNGYSDFTVWRPSTGTFYVLRNTSVTPSIFVHWGQNGDVPVSNSNVH